MNPIYRTMTFAGVNLLALGANAADPTILNPLFSNTLDSNQIQVMNDVQLRAIEASHLEVYAGCKWGHAAFDPVQVESENLSSEVQSIYGEMVVA